MISGVVTAEFTWVFQVTMSLYSCLGSRKTCTAFHCCRVSPRGSGAGPWESARNPRSQNRGRSILRCLRATSGFGPEVKSARAQLS